MSLDQLAQVGEFIGGIAVLVTLVLLLIQLRQGNRTIESTASSNFSSQIAGWHGRCAENSELLRVFDLGVNNQLEDAVDVARFKWFIAEYFLLCESAFFRYKGGQIEEETWQSYLSVLLGFLELEIIRAQWDNKEVAISVSYRQHIAAAIQTNNARHKIPTPGSVVRVEKDS